MWYDVVVRGAGAKPLRAHGYVEANSIEEANERAKELFLHEFSLFGVDQVLSSHLATDDREELERLVANVGSPNTAFTKSGEKITRKSLQ